MKSTKSLKFMIAGIFAIILVASVVSATVTISSVPVLSQDGGTFDITIESTVNETVALSMVPDSITQSSKVIDFDFSSSSVVLTANQSSAPITVTYTVENGFDFKFGKSYSTNLIATDSATTPQTFTKKLTFEQSSYCEVENLGGNLDVEIRDITVKEGFGDDEDWYALDEVEIEVRVENNGNDDIDNIEVEWVILDSNGNEVMDGDESDFRLKDGKDEDVVITLDVDPDDFDGSGEDFTFHVRATGEDEEFDDAETCSSDSDDINLVRPDDFVILSDINFQEVVQCGDDIQFTADVWNIGDDDQDDVVVRAFLDSKFKIDRRTDIGDIDSFEDESYSLNFPVPTDVDEGFYTIRFTVLDDNNDIYESDDDDESEFLETFKVEGGCSGSTGTPSVPRSGTGTLVSASLQSGGNAGEELVISASVTNTGSETTSYTVGVSSFGSWASLDSIEPSTLVLDAGESQDATIRFDVHNSASGEQTFNVEATPSGQSPVIQPVSVTISKASGSGITGGIIGGNNAYLWGIGALNIILVIIIIIVAVRVARS
jgi:hypothetical protein